MLKLISFLMADMKRALISFNILAAAISTTFFLFMAIVEDIKNFWGSGKIDIIYLYNTAIASDLSVIVLVLGTLPFALSFLEDFENNCLPYAISRGGTYVYSLSKIIICVVSSIMSIMIGQILLIVLLLPFFKIYEASLYNSGYKVYFSLYYSLFDAGNHALYLILSGLLVSLRAAVLACASLAISTKIRDRFVALGSPIIIYYLAIIGARSLKLPSIINPSAIYEGVILFSNDMTAQLYVYCYTFFITWITFILFHRGVRRIINEM